MAPGETFLLNQLDGIRRRGASANSREMAFTVTFCARLALGRTRGCIDKMLTVFISVTSVGVSLFPVFLPVRLTRDAARQHFETQKRMILEFHVSLA